jgi:ribonuclease P protein subunit POP4
MKITPNIVKQEFIGTFGTISQSRHFDYIGINGKVVNETKNTISILQNNKIKRIIKKSSIFRFKFQDGTIAQIRGSLLVGRPEDRLKKKIKRLW